MPVGVDELGCLGLVSSIEQNFRVGRKKYPLVLIIVFEKLLCADRNDVLIRGMECSKSKMKLFHKKDR